MTLSKSERAASRLQAVLDAHVGWNIEADVRDVVAGFSGIKAENDALRRKLNAVRGVVERLREAAAASQYATYESAYTDAADWLEEALSGGEPS